jgi:hypothetical protein
MRVNQASYYAQLEHGARFLAANSAEPKERERHLGWANRYHRLGAEARPERATPTTAQAA